MKTKREVFIETALGEIGTKESPAGSNKVKYNNKNGQPWCGWFVMWCAKKAKIKIPNVVYTPSGVESFKGIGEWSNAETAKPQPGDIVFFDFPGGEKTDHVGIVIKDNLDGTITTVEGNTSGSGSQSNGGEVMEKVRAYKKNNRKKLPVFVSGFGHPRWGKM
jgi:hypothetical protein